MHYWLLLFCFMWCLHKVHVTLRCSHLGRCAAQIYRTRVIIRGLKLGFTSQVLFFKKKWSMKDFRGWTEESITEVKGLCVTQITKRKVHGSWNYKSAKVVDSSKILWSWCNKPLLLLYLCLSKSTFYTLHSNHSSVYCSYHLLTLFQTAQG